MNAIPTFTNAARETLLRLDISAQARTALENAEYNRSRNYWTVDIDEAANQQLKQMLREENQKA